MSCFHCGLPIPPQAPYYVEIDTIQQPMCCMGCQAVASAIVASGLTDFYRFRDAPTPNAPVETLVPSALLDLTHYDHPTLQQAFVTEQAASVKEAALILEGIVCAACVWLNEHHVQQLTGVQSFQVNYSTHRATLRWNETQIKLSTILAAIRTIGYQAHPFNPQQLASLQQKEKSTALKRIGVAGLGMMQVMMLSTALYIGEDNGMSSTMQHYFRWISLLITLPVLIYAAQVFFRAAWRDLRRYRLGMDVPVALALGITFSASVWATVTQSGEVYFDSVTMFTFFLLGGRYLEMAARHKAGQVAEELVRLLPATATQLINDKPVIVAVSELNIADQVLIKPGEIIPTDGMVLSGKSTINEALLTGESTPCLKQVGDTLTAGTLNIDSPLTMQVVHIGEQTTLAAIVRLLERAQAEKPALARIAEGIVHYFVPIILGLASLVGLVWYFYQPEQAFWVALSLLVITCPCAFSLATPAALTTATGLLTSKGVLTTRGHALETLAQVTDVVFDKTGTLTHGELQLISIKRYASLSKQACHQLAAGLEQASEHPIAQALLQGIEPFAVEHLSAVAGQGVQGEWQGAVYRLGCWSFIKEWVSTPAPMNEAVTVTNAYSTLYLASSQGLVAIFELADTLRPNAKATVAALQAQGIQVHLLSGDQVHVVRSVSQQIGIEKALGAKLPADKLQYVQDLQEKGHIVAMIGDGVNDAPVLAMAQVSIAMGKGTQLAQASADMVLLSDDLRRIPFAIDTARQMQKIIKQNFVWTILYNGIAIPLAALGLVQPWMAVLGMSMSSLVVVLNALRLRL